MSAPSVYVEFFGPALWKSMHSIAYAAPVEPTIEQQRSYVDFYRSLGDVIPCPACRVHYKAYLDEHPIDASSREALTRWVYDLHDSVNRRRGKTSPSRQAVDAHYSGWNATRHAKYSASANRERVLASPHMEDAVAEEARWDAAAAALVIAGVVGVAAFVYVRQKRSADSTTA